jgi:hypothetical protein
MITHATGTFEGKSWDETPYNQVEGLPKLSRVSSTDSFEGDVEGVGTLEYLIAYRDENSGSFAGLERVIGHIDGRSGSFVLQHSGTFEGRTVKGDWFVVPGSGTGELHGLRGEGVYEWRGQDGQQHVCYTLDYDFE